MFCYQCEQTAGCHGCTIKGVCGKTPEAAALQDLIVYAAKGISTYMHKAKELGAAPDEQIDKHVVEALFTTVTNVSFDNDRLASTLHLAAKLKTRAKELYEKVCQKKGVQPEKLNGPCSFEPAGDVNSLVVQGEQVSIDRLIDRVGDVKAGLIELITYGLKGTAAYADHARVLGVTDSTVNAFFHECLTFLNQENHEVNDLLGMALKVGEVNLRVMEMLDEGNTSSYGHPEPTAVRVTPLKGKAILVSGHDLKDLDLLLQQTEGKNINVYTHGEMLPCLAYPGLKKYKHLVGNYGGAWQDQAKEFEAFPGPILMTTNCIQKPRDSYKDRIFTTGLVSWPGVKHLEEKNFTPVIEAALTAQGFAQDDPEKTIMIGFGRDAVLSVADKVIDAVKQGDIKHFFLVGGCDGAKSGRNYYTELAEEIPKDCVVLTLACGKYRFNKLEFGDIGGIPRLLDIGQCNDAYSAIKIAVALAGAFETDVNSLPLSMILSWYEQKAVCILLTLLHLGITNIRLGPTMPAFVSPAAYEVLKEKFNLMPITTAKEDLKAILG